MSLDRRFNINVEVIHFGKKSRHVDVHHSDIQKDIPVLFLSAACRILASVIVFVRLIFAILHNGYKLRSEMRGIRDNLVPFRILFGERWIREGIGT